MTSSSQMRAVALLLAAVLVGASCSGDDAPAAAPPSSRPASTTTAPPPPREGVEVELLSSAVIGVGAADGLPEKTTAEILRIVELYVQRAMVDPLVTAQPAVQLDTLFSDASIGAALGADRALLVDEGLPRIEEHPYARANVRLVAFRGPGGTVDLVGATVRFRVRGRTPDGRVVEVVRAGDLSLVPQGHWRIESYTFDVDRQVVAA